MLVSIYQIKDSRYASCGYLFRQYKVAKEHGFSLDDYYKVYSYFIEVPPTEENNYSVVLSESETNTLLDKIFEKFNTDRPEDFKGHSLSVSDLVMLDTDIYYCDNMGWKKI